MSTEEINEFLSKNINDQLLEFYDFPFEKQKEIFQHFDSEKKKSFLNQMLFSELKKFIIAINFDSDVINLLSPDTLKAVVKSFSSEDKQMRNQFLKNIKDQKDLFLSLSDSEKKDFFGSLSISELETIIYSNHIYVGDVVQILGNDYLKNNASNMSYRFSKDVMAVLNADIFRKEGDIRVLEGNIENLKKKKNNDSVISSMNSSLDVIKNDVNNLKETLRVSQESQKENHDKLAQEISNFSKECLQLRNAIPKDDSSFRRISHLVTAEEDIVMHLYRFGFISDDYFNIVTKSLSSEEKQVFLEFMNKANSIMTGKIEDNHLTDENAHKEENNHHEEKKEDKTNNLPKLKNNIQFEKHVIDAAMEKYHQAGYHTNANGWYFDPSTDEYVEGYHPVNDPLFNSFIHDKNREAAMDAYRSAGYGTNANGWYFDPNADEYVEGYDPTLDSTFNNSILKQPNQNKKHEDNTKSNHQSNSSVIVQKMIDYLNQNQEKFGATFVSSDDLKNVDGISINGKPIISLSEVDKKILMEFVGWKKTKKDSKQIDDVYKKIKSFMENSEEFGVNFTNFNTYYSLPSLISIKEKQGITSLTDEEKEKLKHSVIYQVKLEEQQNLNQGHGRSSHGNVNYLLVISLVVIAILFLLFLILF